MLCKCKRGFEDLQKKKNVFDFATCSSLEGKNKCIEKERENKGSNFIFTFCMMMCKWLTEWTMIWNMYYAQNTLNDECIEMNKYKNE